MTTDNITFTIGILCVIFTVFNYFNNPQKKLEKEQALTEQEIDSQSTIFEKQLKWEKEATEKRFEELNKTMTAALTLAQNHIHTVDTKVDSLAKTVNAMNLQISSEITKLSTIINERIPKK